MIQTEDLSKQFGDTWAVDGVTLDVQPGQVLALLGQNGAGKTTTVRMLTSVLAPTRGWARIAGYDVVQSPAQVRASVGVLTEQHGLYLRMTGEEYLDFYGQDLSIWIQPNDINAAETGWNTLAWPRSLKRPIGQYSKGMRQKLALARTLLHSPPVLLLDEPTSAMDPESAQLVRKAIASLRSEQTDHHYLHTQPGRGRDAGRQDRHHLSRPYLDKWTCRRVEATIIGAGRI